MLRLMKAETWGFLVSGQPLGVGVAGGPSWSGCRMGKTVNGRAETASGRSGSPSPGAVGGRRVRACREAVNDDVAWTGVPCHSRRAPHSSGSGRSAALPSARERAVDAEPEPPPGGPRCGPRCAVMVQEPLRGLTVESSCVAIRMRSLSGEMGDKATAV